MSAKFYRMPVVIEKETEKAIFDEQLGWFPKSKIEVEAEKDNNGIRWMIVPAWLLANKGHKPSLMCNVFLVTR